jgi:hypothetical protein
MADGQPHQPPFAWALGDLATSSDPVVKSLIGGFQSQRLSEALQATHRLAFGEPANEEIIKQGRAFDRRSRQSPGSAIAALYELLVLAVLRCQFCSLAGIEMRGQGSTTPDYQMRTIAEQPFMVEVKTIFRGEKLLQYEARLEDFQNLLLKQLARRHQAIASLEVLAGVSEIPSSTSDIRACIKRCEREAQVARSRNRRFCCASTPSGASICIELEGVKYDLSNPFEMEVNKIDNMRAQMSRSFGQQRLGLVCDGDEHRDYERRIRYKIGRGLAQLEKSEAEMPWVVALGIGDPSISLRKATLAALRFLRERASSSDHEQRLHAALVASFFDPEFDRLLRSAPQPIRQEITQRWSDCPVCSANAVWVTVNKESLRMNGIRTIDLTEGQTLWQVQETPRAVIWERAITDHTRHDGRLVLPEAHSARYVALTHQGHSVAGWSGNDKSLDQLPLCLRDLARCTSRLEPGEIVEVIKKEDHDNQVGS